MHPVNQEQPEGLRSVLAAARRLSTLPNVTSVQQVLLAWKTALNSGRIAAHRYYEPEVFIQTAHLSLPIYFRRKSVGGVQWVRASFWRSGLEMSQNCEKCTNFAGSNGPNAKNLYYFAPTLKLNWYPERQQTFLNSAFRFLPQFCYRANSNKQPVSVPVNANPDLSIFFRYLLASLVFRSYCRLGWVLRRKCVEICWVRIRYKPNVIHVAQPLKKWFYEALTVFKLKPINNWTFV